MARPLDIDDEDETLHCYRHPARETALQCIDCDRPICFDCAVQGAVGFKCPDHARTSRAARGVVPAARLARGAVGAIVVAVVLGGLLSVIRIPFFGLFLAYGAGIATAEAARRASGGYRDPVLARIATTAAFVGIGALPIAGHLLGEVGTNTLAYGVVGAIIGAVGAYTRAA